VLRLGSNRDVQDTSGGDDDSEDNIMHAPNANDLDDTDYEESGNVLQEEPFSSNKDNSAQYSPKPPTPLPTPAETPPFSALPTSSSIPAQDPPFAPETPAQDPPLTPETAVAGLPTIEISDDHRFSLDGPVTRIGRKRKARDLHSILQVCTCGQTVHEGEKQGEKSRDDVIQCKAVGCETVWVSVNCQNTFENRKTH